MIQTTAPALLAAVNGASSKIKPNHSMSALEHVEVGAASVFATDMEIQGEQRYAATGGDETYLLQSAALKRILTKIGDAAIVLTAAESGEAVVTLANGSAFTLAQLPGGEYPKALPLPAAERITLDVPAATLRNMLERALVAASKDEARPVLTSIMLEQHPEGFAIVACDSYRLHVLEHGTVGHKDGPHALLPRRFAEAIVERIKKLKPETVTIAAGTTGGGHARVTVGDWTGSCLLISGQFPNFRSLFPDNAAATAILPAAAMMSAIDMAEAVGARSNAPLKLTVGDASSISLDSKTGAAFTAPLNVLYAPEPECDTADGMTIGYNGAFLADMIGAAQSDSPILSLISPLRPSWITSVGCAQCGTPIDGYGVSFRGLLMPIRIG